MRHVFRIVVVMLWIFVIFALIQFPQLKKNSSSRPVLNVFCWDGYFENRALIANFEKRYGIQVRLYTYSSNEELLIKLQSLKGKSYDIIFPSDYAVPLLKEKNLIKKIDHSKLNFLDRITPFLMGLDYDPENQYAIPNQWEVYGIAVSNNYKKDSTVGKSLKSIFDFSKNPELMIGMTSDPVEAVCVASAYLYGDVIKGLSDNQLKEIQALLKRQKKNVEAYSDYRLRYLLETGNCHVAFCRSSAVWFINSERKMLTFSIPDEAAFITIENVCIPKTSSKDDLIYTFLNYIYEPQVHAAHLGDYSAFPSQEASLPFIEKEEECFKAYKSIRKKKNIKFFSLIADESKIRQVWVESKSS